METYIDFGDAAANKSLFDNLLLSRPAIEAEFHETLEWERLDARRASRIASYFPGSIDSSPDELQVIREGIVNRLIRMKAAMGPYLRQPAATASSLASVSG